MASDWGEDALEFKLKMEGSPKFWLDFIGVLLTGEFVPYMKLTFGVEHSFELEST